ncbi:hypothetical protein CDPAHKCJ_00380 [Cobetia sp. MB87]|nr:hypothetical protein [Cobetia sp. MB87]
MCGGRSNGENAQSAKVEEAAKKERTRSQARQRRPSEWAGGVLSWGSTQRQS